MGAIPAVPIAAPIFEKPNTLRVYGLHKNTTIEIFHNHLKNNGITDIKNIRIFKHIETKIPRFGEVTFFNPDT